MRFYVPTLSIVALLCTATLAPAAPAQTCVFTLGMSSGVDVNSLDFQVKYLGADGFIGGTERFPECANALNGQAFAAFRDDDAAKQLTVSLVRLSYFSAPTNLVGCRFYYDDLVPAPGDFTTVVTNASRDAEDEQVTPKPVIVVTSIECPGVLPTPTTLPPDTTTTTLAGNAGCGVPVSGGDKPTASDALRALKAAVGTASCPLCVCDVNSNGSVAAADALAILRAAVGVATPLVCPPC